MATEDPVSEAVARKLISVVAADVEITVALGGRGSTYLRSKVNDLNRTAQTIPVFLLIDLDRQFSCARQLLDNLVGRAQAPHFIIRVAVVEVESWILADRSNLPDFLGVAANRVPMDTDVISDPKKFLVNLARRSRKNIRHDLVPSSGSLTEVGPAYNPRMVEFVSQKWDPLLAQNYSESLRRAVRYFHAR
ncbi:MAG: hypothetical protein U1E66_03320 [Rhodospirillales bacterium]